ncbi:MAG: hypothetical protein MJ092_07275, partial [Lachnospiraceae bacterium]|nr:hypothetical protein [Lachnospiraceae bacterium]
IYMALDKLCRNEIVKAVLIVILTAAGAFLGKFGLWLPWSIDCALYSMVFYYLGVLAKQYKIFELVRDNHFFYFLLSPIWAYMIYKGAMELAIRQYAPYGLVIVGALCGILLIYRFSAYIGRSLILSSRILNYIGKSSIVLLIVHVLLNGKMLNFCENHGINSAVTMVVCVGLQILISVIAFGIISKIKKAIKENAMRTQIVKKRS